MVVLTIFQYGPLVKVVSKSFRLFSSKVFKTLWALHMDGVQLSQDSLLFTRKSPEVHVTHLINLGCMKGLVDPVKPGLE